MYEPQQDERPGPAMVPADEARRRERGIVLVATMAMLSLITVLCSAAVVRTSADIREGGSERIAQAALRLAEGGALGSVALAAQMQLEFSEYVANRSGVLTMSDIGHTTIDITPVTGSFGREFDTAHMVAPTFSTVVTETEMSAAVPGYDAARYCFKTYNMVTTSQFGTDTGTTLLQIEQAGQQKIQTYVTVGPILCGI